MVGSFKLEIGVLQKQSCPFCVLPLFLWDFAHGGKGVHMCVFVCVKSFCVSVLHALSLFIHLSICMCTHTFVIDEHFSVCMCAHVSVYFAMYVQNWSALFSRHSCNRTGLMCNPSRHFKGREAWTDVVLLVYQMGLYDEKSIIPIQASLPSLVHYKAIHSFFFYCKK